ncbi:GYDIA family GHMP kinase [Winogradskyella sp.]|uniref:GYDIA family GHMP kinase n=1 Tax=Winogradskyella sp. TaxID=1883156 RepID=UPI0035C7904A
MTKFKSNGKLLLTAEYLVLDGAKALALPTSFGQQLLIENNNSDYINWKSFDESNNIWFNDKFLIENILSNNYTSSNKISQKLIEILRSVNSLTPNFLKQSNGFNIKTTQDFNRNWGLGTSSTLINNVADWANVNAYKLLELTFGGSGYDIACAQNDNAISYQLTGKNSSVITVDFNPSFKNHIYFVYLNQKQNSRDGIAAYRNYKGDLKASISKINHISDKMILCDNQKEFEALIVLHEDIISKIINLKPVKEVLFSDFNGAIKSLGAWGGDFVMVTSKTNPVAYFEAKGFNTIIPYNKMIKS